ncbi:hypothetical protein ACWC0C_22115 [Streptomyces sp. NPDC001709]
MVRKAGFSAYFLLGAAEEAAVVDDADAWVRLPDGSRWSATLMTPDAIGAVLRRWTATGVFSPARISSSFPKPGVPAMTAALREIVAQGPRGTLVRLED